MELNELIPLLVTILGALAAIVISRTKRDDVATKAQDIVNTMASELRGENSKQYARIDALETHNHKLESDNAVLRSDLDEKSTQLTATNTRLALLVAELHEVRMTVQRMTTERAVVDGELEKERTRAGDLDRQLTAARARITELEIKVIRLEARLDAKAEAEAGVVQPLLEGFAKLLQDVTVNAPALARKIETGKLPAVTDMLKPTNTDSSGD